MDENEGTYDFQMNTLETSNQMTKINKGQLLHKDFPEVPAKISKSNIVAAIEIKKISLDKIEHQTLLKNKKDLQNLIEFQSPRITLIETPSSEFSKHIQISQTLQLITLDGEPIPELMLCKKCNQVRARCRLTVPPIAPHLKQHEQFEAASNFDKKKRARILTRVFICFVSYSRYEEFASYFEACAIMRR